jgi:hypothetical protein
MYILTYIYKYAHSDTNESKKNSMVVEEERKKKEKVFTV